MAAALMLVGVAAVPAYQLRRFRLARQVAELRLPLAIVGASLLVQAVLLLLIFGGS
jgi:hypothetical protein